MTQPKNKPSQQMKRKGGKRSKIDFSSGRPGRKYNTRQARQTILIVCEGAKTEPYYFDGFRQEARLASIQIEIKGTGFNSDSLVNEAIRINNEGPRFDQVWCVFDKDDFKDEQISRAFDLARSNGIRIAYSNEAFELWYLLHYNYITAGLTRKELSDKLTERLGKKYEKNDSGMYRELLPKQKSALRNSKRLLKRKGAKCDPNTPCPVLSGAQGACHITPYGNPSTTIVCLVEVLLHEMEKQR